MPHELGSVSGHARYGVPRERSGSGHAPILSDERPLLFRTDAADITLRNRSEMQLCPMFDVKRIRHKGQYRVALIELGQATLFGRIVDGRQTSRRPPGSRDSRRGELVHKRL